MQLVAYGAQDVYLTGNPQITFWKVTYRRHTNFAMESIEQTFNGQADFGRRVTCTISRNGDLAYRTYLQVTLPEINQSMVPTPMPTGVEGVYARWLDFPGEQMISQVEVEIGGQRIDRQYGDWMHLWNQTLMAPATRRPLVKSVHLVMPSLKPPSTCPFSSGIAAIPGWHCLSLPSSTTRSRSTWISAPLMNVSGPSPV